MATRRNRPRGIYDRGSSWQVKIKRLDAKKQLHAITRTFPYDGGAPAFSPHSRSSALARAEDFAAGQRAALRFEKRPASARPNGQTLDMLLTAFADDVLGGMTDDPDHPPRRETFRRSRSMIKRLREEAPALLQRQLLELQGDDFRGKGKLKMQPPESLAGILSTMERPLASSSIVRYLDFVSSVFTWAAEHHGMHDLPNPLRGLIGTWEDDDRDRLITQEEWQAVLAELADIAPPIVAAIKFLRATGARRGETVALRWQDIKWSQEPPMAHLRSETTKGGDGRDLPLLDEAVRALEPLRIGQGDEKSWPKSGPVFGVHADSVTHAWLHACERAMLTDVREHGRKAKLDLDDARLHDLRHTRLTEITAQMPLQDAMLISGHKTIRMLLRYYNRKPIDVGRDLQQKERAALATAATA